jgi:pantoate--beta-alanine ligase
VLKLFNITGCRSAAFGLKDFQQAMVLRRMVNDLNVPVKLFFGEIIREPDGLAMSSRNVYLSPEERASALVVSRALFSAKKACEAGERRATQVAKQIESDLKRETGIRIEYVEVVDNTTLTQVELIDRPSRVAVAVYVGKTRLIDNIGVG